MDDDDLEAGLRRVLSQRSRQMSDNPVRLDAVYAGASRRRAHRRAASAVAGAALLLAVVAGFGAWHVAAGPAPVVAAPSTPAPTFSSALSPSPSVAVSSTPATATAQPSTTVARRLPVPTGFSPVSVTAISASHWWVLGSDGLLATTVDGGATFALTSPSGLGPDAQQVRFATNAVGWALTGTSSDPGGSLWSTWDGGRTWAVVHGLDGPAYAVEAGGGTVFTITLVADGTWSVWGSPVGTSAWHRLGSLGAIVPGAIPRLAVQAGRAIIAGLNPNKVNVFVFAASGARTVAAAPCSPDLGPGDLSATVGSVWLTCHEGMGDGLYSSANGLTWTVVPSASPKVSRITVGAIDATGAAVGLQDGSLRLVSSASSAVTLGKGGPRTEGGWDYVAFTNPSDGFAINSLAASLLRTIDGGLTWTAVALR